MKSVYSAVRTVSLNKSVCASSVKGLLFVEHCEFRFWINIGGTILFLATCCVVIHSVYFRTIEAQDRENACHKISVISHFNEGYSEQILIVVSVLGWVYTARQYRSSSSFRMSSKTYKHVCPLFPYVVIMLMHISIMSEWMCSASV